MNIITINSNQNARCLSTKLNHIQPLTQNDLTIHIASRRIKQINNKKTSLEIEIEEANSKKVLKLV